MGRLNDLGVKYRTDKSSLYHGYLDFYERIFDELGFTEGSFVWLLEIGVLGGSSLKMWKEYFSPQSLIIGMDIDVAIDDIAIVKMDAYSQAGLSYIQAMRPNILLDDGSHKSKDVINLVNSLLETKDTYFPDLLIYEDCHAAFWEEYTPKGELNAYHYCYDAFEELGYDIRVFKKNGDFSDSVTMAIIKK